MNNPREHETENDDRDLEIGRPHGPREEEEERDGERVSSDVPGDEEEEDQRRDDDNIFDKDDRADDGDLDVDPEDDM